MAAEVTEAAQTEAGAGPSWLTPRAGARVVAEAGCVMAVVEGLIMVGLPWLRLPAQAEVFADPAILVTVGAPLLYAFVVRRYIRQLRVMYGNLTHQSRRRTFESQLRRAFGMAYDEDAAVEVARRAMAELCPTEHAQLRLTDDAQTRLATVISVEDGARPGTRPRTATGTDDPAARLCAVSEPGNCPAIVSGRPQLFPERNAIDACPQLRLGAAPGELTGGGPAACLPVTSLGRSLGVLHVTGNAASPLDPEAVYRLNVLAGQAGAEIGLRRSLVRTQVLADTDPLTRLLNRHSFTERARALLAGSGPYGVIMADLDHFKALNDEHGHDRGDQALRTAARVIKASVRDVDLVARYGGEEFVLLLPGVDLDSALRVAERVRGELAMAAASTQDIATTASLGLAVVPEGTLLADAVHRADQALLEAKRAGRNRVQVATPVSGTAVPPAVPPAAPPAVPPAPPGAVPSTGVPVVTSSTAGAR